MTTQIRIRHLSEDPVRMENFPAEGFSVGRLADKSDLLYQGSPVSREHAEIRPEKGVYVLRDVGSSNGTFLNHMRVHEQEAISTGDQITFGSGGPTIEVVLLPQAPSEEEDHISGFLDSDRTPPPLPAIPPAKTNAPNKAKSAQLAAKNPKTRKPNLDVPIPESRGSAGPKPVSVDPKQVLMASGGVSVVLVSLGVVLRGFLVPEASQVAPPPAEQPVEVQAMAVPVVLPPIADPPPPPPPPAPDQTPLLKKRVKTYLSERVRVRFELVSDGATRAMEGPGVATSEGLWLSSRLDPLAVPLWARLLDQGGAEIEASIRQGKNEVGLDDDTPLATQSQLRLIPLPPGIELTSVAKAKVGDRLAIVGLKGATSNYPKLKSTTSGLIPAQPIEVSGPSSSWLGAPVLNKDGVVGVVTRVQDGRVKQIHPIGGGG